MERLCDKRIVAPKQKTIASEVPIKVTDKPNLLIDIQAKVQQGYGLGFENWAKLQNLKESAKTPILLQENDLTDYYVLSEKADVAGKKFSETSGRIKEIEARLSEISTLQKHIGTYGKTLEVYRQYRNSG